MKRIYTSIDIGSNTIKILVAEWYRGRANVLAVAEAPSVGIKRGLVVDAETARKSISDAIIDLEEKLDFKINKAIVTVPANNSEYKVMSAETIVCGENSIVTENDIVNIYKNIIGNNISEERELVSILPIQFQGDGQVLLDRPIGNSVSNLKLIAMIVTVPKKNIQSIISLMASLNVDVVDVSTSTICDYYCYKNDLINNKIGAIINIGEEITNVGIVTKGVITDSTIVAMGASNIDNDLSYLFKLSTKDKQIKENFAIAHKRYANSKELKEIININGKKIRINQYEVSEIVMDRLTEILEVAKKEINNLTNSEISYIIITGGISNIIGFKYLGNEIFGKKFIERNIPNIGIRNNKYSTVLGNIHYFNEKLKLRDKKYSMVNDDDRLYDLQKKQINSGDSLFSKIFGYFFEN